MPKHIDNVPKLSDFRPPWITEDGSEVEINKDNLKKYLHGLITDKAKAQDSRDETVEKLTKAEAEREDFKGQVDSKDPDSAGKIAKLETQVKDAEAKAAAAELTKDRAEIALDKGLTLNQAKRLVGGTRDELEKDADELAKDLGLGEPKNDDDDDDDDDDAAQGRTTPQVNRQRLVSGTDPASGSEAPVDYDKVAAEIQRSNPFA